MVQLMWKWSRIGTRWEVQRQAISVEECSQSSHVCDIRLVYNKQLANEIAISYRSVQSILKDMSVRCVCVCAENLWQHALSHHLLFATVLVGKTNCNCPWLLYSPDLALCNLLAFQKTQHWVYRPLFCIHWRNATEHNSRSHIYNTRGLPEELSAMAGLLEHLCT